MAEFIKLPEAMEYRETIAILEKMKNQTDTLSMEQIIANEFPSTLT